MHFTLADIDSKYLNIYIKINARMAQINCFLFNNLLQSLKSQNNGFIKTFDMLGEELVIFNYEHNLFVPKCHEIKRIEIIHEQNSCFKLFKVRFSYNRKFIDAFLLNNNLIIDAAEKTMCDRKFIYHYFKNENIIIVDVNNTIQMFNNSRKNFQLKHDSFNIKSLNFIHESEEIQGLNDLESVQLMIANNIVGNRGYMEVDEAIQWIEPNNYLNKYWIWTICLSIIFILIIVLTILFFKYKTKLQHCCGAKGPGDKEIEMVKSETKRVSSSGPAASEAHKDEGYEAKKSKKLRVTK